MTEKPDITKQPSGEAAERIVIRDKRKIDPTGGKGRHASPAKPAHPAESAEEEATTGGRAGHAAPDGTAPARPVPVATGDATGDGPEEDAPGPGDGGVTAPAMGGGRGADADTGRPGANSGRHGADAGRHGADTGGPEAKTGGVGVAPGGLGAELQALRADLEERTRDLQRVTAEYANYRKRVDRDRGVAAEQTTGTVLAALLPILDDLDRARDHGDLVGPFAAVAEQLNAALAKFGLTAFGEKGDPFDPTRHDAVAHLKSDEVSESTCIEVMRRGYLLGERLLRPALVAVADPE
ncbi:MAG TPA: nucleotide exchange factor GrpE [Pilimelia sp.]|nr:nucleotide exchange factor GrpE [Pilimelia sp.]